MYKLSIISLVAFASSVALAEVNFDLQISLPGKEVKEHFVADKTNNTWKYLDNDLQVEATAVVEATETTMSFEVKQRNEETNEFEIVSAPTMKLENGKNGVLSFNSKTKEGHEVEVMSISVTVTH